MITKKKKHTHTHTKNKPERSETEHAGVAPGTWQGHSVLHRCPALQGDLPSSDMDRGQQGTAPSHKGISIPCNRAFLGTCISRISASPGSDVTLETPRDKKMSASNIIISTSRMHQPPVFPSVLGFCGRLALRASARWYKDSKTEPLPSSQEGIREHHHPRWLLLHRHLLTAIVSPLLPLVLFSVFQHRGTRQQL